jgi:hypothetical protein
MRPVGERLQPLGTPSGGDGSAATPLSLPRASFVLPITPFPSSAGSAAGRCPCRARCRGRITACASWMNGPGAHATSWKSCAGPLRTAAHEYHLAGVINLAALVTLAGWMITAPGTLAGRSDHAPKVVSTVSRFATTPSLCLPATYPPLIERVHSGTPPRLGVPAHPSQCGTALTKRAAPRWSRGLSRFRPSRSLAFSLTSGSRWSTDRLSCTRVQSLGFPGSPAVRL